MTHMQNTCRRQENTHAKQNSTCHNFPGPRNFPKLFCMAIIMQSGTSPPAMYN